MAVAEVLSATRELPLPFDVRSDEVRAFRATITPEIAARLIALDSPNRPLSRGTVLAYARAMRAGLWKLNGEPLQFSKFGDMLNGQHRCHACVEANTPFDVMVVVGLEPDTQTTMDDPRRRTVVNQLALKQVEVPTQAVSAARWLLRCKLGSIKAAQRLTNPEVMAAIEQHPHLSDSARKLAKTDVVALLPSVAVAIHYIGAVLLGKPELADKFLEVMQTGVPAYPGDPAHFWREKLIKARGPHSNGLPGKIQWDGTCLAWNLFAKQEALKRWTMPDEPVDIEGLDVSRI